MSKPVKVIKPGKLRERVKSGELNPKDVLNWLTGQPHYSEPFANWLRNFSPRPVEEKPEPKSKKTKRKRKR